MDVGALATDLRKNIRGEVRFDAGSLALYATDAGNYRHVPYGVVIPRDVDDLVAAVAACRRFGAPVVNRGGGTGLTSGCANVAVVMDSSKYVNNVLSLNADERTARVEPGVVLDTLRDQANRHGLTFGPDPSTHNRCTLGGMIGNNACGMHAQMSGRVADNVHELDVLTYDGLRLTVGRTSPEELESIIRAGGRRGEIYQRLKAVRDRYAEAVRSRYPAFPRRISGYNLDELLPENGFHVARALVGSESTCVTVLGAKLRLVYYSPRRTLVALGFPDIYAAADRIMDAVDFGPTALEGMDDRLISFVKKEGGARAKTLRMMPEGKAFLIVEFGGESKQEADAKADRMVQAFKRGGLGDAGIKRFDDPGEEEEIWQLRESSLGATAFVPGREDTHEGWEDSAVPPEHMGDYLRGFRRLLDRYEYDTAIYGHFGQGCLHCRINFDFHTTAGRGKYRSFINDAADLVLSFGGSLSGEHGDGQSRSALLPKMFGPELIRAFREFKSLWDPDFKMNPRRIVGPAEPEDDLRLGQAFHPAAPKTHFTYPDDHGSLQHATVRCVGVGLCRREKGGTMCPSYRVTHEEQHTTRGRAHMLYEMLQGDVVKGGWQNDQVKDALSLCLSCKGCKGDCPVQVDVATLKAEFLSHHYAGRLRPMPAYTMGLIHVWAGLAARAPALANAVTQTPGLSRLVRRLGGLTEHRPMPAFASETFRAWFKRRPLFNADRAPVLLWADTFNNHFHPDRAKAAVDVLEDAGFRVLVSDRPLCCGRPLYDYGFLGMAKSLLRENLTALDGLLARGVPVVGLEPSCLSTFRDELPSLLPGDERAERLTKQTYLLSDFLTRCAPAYSPPKLAGKALVQHHCHHKAIFGFEDEVTVMQKLGLDFEVLDSGCCGLAGSFGFEADKYAVSRKIAEQVLIPRINGAPKDTLILADGFSCHTQIEQLTGKKSLHLAEAMQIAIRSDGRLAAARKAAGFLEPQPKGAGLLTAYHKISSRQRRRPPPPMRRR